MNFSVLGENSKLLPAFCKPYCDELLSSWLARLSFDHGLNVTEFCQLTWGIKNRSSLDVDRYIPEDIIELLAGQTNCSFEEVKNATMLYYENKLFEKLSLLQRTDKWMFIRDQYLAKGQTSGLMFCPACLSNPGNPVYYRKQWYPGISFVCLNCGCYLMDNCPHCKMGITFISKPISAFIDRSVSEYLATCHYCHRDIRQCTPIAAPEKLLRLQQQLYDIMENGFNDKLIYTSSYFSVLHHITHLLLSNRHNTIGKGKGKKKRLLPFIQYAFSVHNIPPVTPSMKNQILYQPVQKRAMVILVAHWLLEEWPSRLLDLCKYFNLKNSDMLCGFKNAPFWFWEPVYSQL